MAWNRYVTPFSYGMWLAVAMAACVLCVCLALTNFSNKNKQRLSLIDTLFYIISCFCLKGQCLWIIYPVFYASFCSSLISYLLSFCEVFLKSFSHSFSILFSFLRIPLTCWPYITSLITFPFNVQFYCQFSQLINIKIPMKFKTKYTCKILSKYPFILIHGFLNWSC